MKGWREGRYITGLRVGKGVTIRDTYLIGKIATWAS